MLLSFPLIALSAGAVGGAVKGAARARRSWPALSRAAARGILCIDGLAAEPALAKRLRSDIVRVLRSAAAGTRPRACACVKESQGAFVGVLRAFNTKGHYILRVSDGSAAAVARRLLAELDAFDGAFPAREGARRVECPECDPKTCPLGRRRRELAFAAA